MRCWSEPESSIIVLAVPNVGSACSSATFVMTASPTVVAATATVSRAMTSAWRRHSRRMSLSVADWVASRGNSLSNNPDDVAARERLVYLFHWMWVDSIVNGSAGIGPTLGYPAAVRNEAARVASSTSVP